MVSFVRWSEAMRQSLYGRGGFYVSQWPEAHFRTSAQVPLFASAVARLAGGLDESLGFPDVFTVVDVGGGGGEFVSQVVESDESGRWRGLVVEVRPRPVGVIDRVEWTSVLPVGLVGLVVANEWLDNVPADVAVVGDDGEYRYELVDPGSGVTTVGPLVSGADLEWLRRWWPAGAVGDSAAIGLSRDEAFRRLCGCVSAGSVLVVDYGHLLGDRPSHACVAGYRDGSLVAPVPDGSMDVTMHVAFDSLGGDVVLSQRDALSQLGVSAVRPPLSLAVSDPLGYVRELSRVSVAADLVDRAGLGRHYWLCSGMDMVLSC